MRVLRTDIKPDTRRQLNKNIAMSVIDVNGLKETNDNLGHAAGDEMICAVPPIAQQAFGSGAFIARIGGDEFAVVTYGAPDELAGRAAEMKDAAAKHKGDLIGAVLLSVGIACRSDYKDLPPEGLFQTADKFMYEDKSAYYRQKGHDRRQRRGPAPARAENPAAD